jgi:hypothetical protein
VFFLISKIEAIFSFQELAWGLDVVAQVYNSSNSGIRRIAVPGCPCAKSNTIWAKYTKA